MKNTFLLNSQTIDRRSSVIGFVCLIQINIESFLQSREQWPYCLLRPSRVDHGEKSNRPRINQSVGKLGLIDFLDYTACNPEIVTSPLKENQINSGIQELSEQTLQLQMEIYHDLSQFYQPKAGRTHPNVVDELNTPVFGIMPPVHNYYSYSDDVNVLEKAHFDYDRQLHSSDLLNVITSEEDQSNFKVRPEILNKDSVNIDDVNNILIQEDSIASENKDLNIISVDKDTSKILNYVVLSSQGINSNQSNTHSLGNSEYEYIYHDSNKVTPMFNELVSEDEEYLPTVNNCSDIFFNSTNSVSTDNIDVESTSIDYVNDQYIILDASPIESLETLKSSTESSHYVHPFNLELDCNKIKDVESLNTPDVIETIDAIELEKGFNILNFITEDDSIKTEPAVPSEDLSLQSTTSNDFPATETVPKQSRKRKIKAEDDDDDDEDYEPPLSFLKHFSSPKQNKRAQSEIENESISKSARRGRPPKKSSEASPKVCADEDEKYREMRDKNNEASRKSRLKRKMKEVAQEEEADELEVRNIRLKTQVAELEKTVNNFRTNLMQILMKK